MKQKAKITQLYKSNSHFIMATCQIHGKEDDDRFECRIEGDNQYKAQLWQWVKGNWKDGVPCEIEFDDVDSLGMPKNAVITFIQGFIFLDSGIITNKGELALEDIEATHMALDKLGCDKFDEAGNKYSIYGRVIDILKKCQEDKNLL